MKLEPGIHKGLGMDEYHAWQLDKANLKAGPISCSMLKEFVVSPYAWLRAEPFTPTAAMQTGSLLDMALTEPHRLAEMVVTSPFENYRTKAAQEWRDETLAAGKVIADPEQIDNARACAEAVRSHEVAGKILEDAEFQVGAVATIGDIPAKCLLDIVPSEANWDETLWDYKTTSNGLDDESIRKTISQYRYHWQSAFYRTVWNKASADRHCENFGFIFQDPKTREVRVVILDDDSMALGTRCVREAVKEYTRCAYNGIHSRYAKTAGKLGVMPYCAMAEEDFIIALEQQ